MNKIHASEPVNDEKVENAMKVFIGSTELWGTCVIQSSSATSNKEQGCEWWIHGTVFSPFRFLSLNVYLFLLNSMLLLRQNKQAYVYYVRTVLRFSPLLVFAMIFFLNFFNYGS